MLRRQRHLTSQPPGILRLDSPLQDDADLVADCFFGIDQVVCVVRMPARSTLYQPGRGQCIPLRQAPPPPGRGRTATGTRLPALSPRDGGRVLFSQRRGRGAGFYNHDFEKVDKVLQIMQSRAGRKEHTRIKRWQKCDFSICPIDDCLISHFCHLFVRFRLSDKSKFGIHDR